MDDLEIERRAGDRSELDRWVPMLYDELRALARQMALPPASHEP